MTYRPEMDDVVDLRCRVIGPDTLSEWAVVATADSRIRIGAAPTRDMQLVYRPQQPKVGTAGIATVRGVPFIRVMRKDSVIDLKPWVSAVSIQGCYLHNAANVTDFVPDVTP